MFKILIITVEIRIMYLSFAFFFSKYQNSGSFTLKCHYDENRIFSIKAILKHKQAACMRRKMPFTIFKYLFLVQRSSSF